MNLCEDQDERRLQDTATRLFADLGYDMVSTEMIAEAAGTDPETVNARYGGKARLYQRAVEEATLRWIEEVQDLKQKFTPDAEGVILIFDAALRYGLEHPEMFRLWMYRWMSDALDVSDMDEKYMAPLRHEIMALMHQATKEDVDAEATMWTLVWSIHGYLQAGILDETANRRPPDDPKMLDRYRAHLNHLIRLVAKPA